MTIPAIDPSKASPIRLRTNPDWLPDFLKKRPERVRIRFKMTGGERRIYRKKKSIPPSLWAPKYRKVTYGPLENSFWDPDFMPHMNGIMDASFHPAVKEIGNCKAPQSGSSAGNETMIGYIADTRPGPVFVVFPDRDTTSKRSTDYLQPMFTKSPRLRGLMTGIQDDMSSLRIRLKVLLLYMGWAGSATALGNISVKFLFLDETDKYPVTPNKKEGGIMGYVRQRLRAFKYGTKMWYTSTPTNIHGHINVFMTTEASAIFDYWVPCPNPDCGRHQRMVFDQIMKSFPKEVTDPSRMEEEKLAGYICRHCGARWDDRQRDKAVCLGQWRARGDGREMFEYLDAEKPEKICFHSPSWISPLVSLSEIAAWWLRGLKNRDDMKTFMNQYKAEPWTDYVSERKEDRILVLRDERPEGLVPSGGAVAALVAGVDTQDYSFIFEIGAFGWGLNQESWQIRYGEVETFEALEQVLFVHEYKDIDGKVYPVHLAVQDAMGHRTTEVYDFVRRWPGRVVPYKGHQRRASPMGWTVVDCYPGTNKPIPGGMRLLNVDTTHYKNALARKLNIKHGDPGAWHLHSAADEDFARQLCVEYRDEHGLWQCPSGKANHFWDASFMRLVAADLIQIKFWAQPEPATVEAETDTPAVMARATYISGK